MTRVNAQRTTSRGISRESPYASAEANEFLLVRVVVRQDQSPRADDRGVALGAAPAGPQLDIPWQIADDRREVPAPSPCLPTPSSIRAPAPEHLPASRSRQSPVPEDPARDTQRPGRCWPRASPHPACRSRGGRPRGWQRATGPWHQAARRVGGTSRGCAAPSRTSGAPAQCRRVLDASRRQPAQAPASARRGEGRGDGGRPPGARSPGRSPRHRTCCSAALSAAVSSDVRSHRIGCRGSAIAPAGTARRCRSVSVSPARRPMLCPCSTAPRNSRRRATSASVYIRPRSSRTGVTAP